MVGQPAQLAVALGRDGDHATAARLHLFDVRQHLLVDAVAGRDEHHRHVLVDQGDRTVLHLRRRIAFGVDVADLLQFESPLQGDREVVAAPEVEKVAVVVVKLGQLADLAVLRQDAGDLIRQLSHRGYQIATALLGHPRAAAEVEAEEGEGHDLRGERLGRGDPDLGPGVDVHPAVRLARDRRAHDVHDGHTARALLLRLPQRRQRVRGLARLRDRDDQRALVEHRVPVAQLGGVLGLHRDPRELLQHVLADQRRMPRRPARREHDAIVVRNILPGHTPGEPAQPRPTLLVQQAAPHRVTHRVGLLEDLLEHVVRESALLDLPQVPRNVADFLGQRTALEIEGPVAVPIQHRQLAVVQIDDLPRVLDHRGGVRCDEEAAVRSQTQ